MRESLVQPGNGSFHSSSEWLIGGGAILTLERSPILTDSWICRGHAHTAAGRSAQATTKETGPQEQRLESVAAWPLWGRGHESVRGIVTEKTEPPTSTVEAFFLLFLMSQTVKQKHTNSEVDVSQRAKCLANEVLNSYNWFHVSDAKQEAENEPITLFQICFYYEHQNVKIRF